MTQKRLSEMSEAEFDSLIDSCIDRTSTSYGEIPAEIFLDLLIERIAAKRGNSNLDFLSSHEFPEFP